MASAALLHEYQVTAVTASVTELFTGTPRLIHVLVEGIIEKIAHAKCAIECGEPATKLINVSLAIMLIELLKKSIEVEQFEFYERDSVQACESLVLMLLQANQQNDSLLLDEAIEILQLLL